MPKKSPDTVDEDLEEEKSSPAPPPRQNPMMIIVAGILGALVCGGGVGAYFLLFNKPSVPPVEEKKDTPALDKEGNPITFFFEIPDIVVNLHYAEGSRRNFLKLKIFLELTRQQDIQALEKIRPRLVDQMQTYLRELTIAELEGAQGAIKLRENLLLRIQTVAAPVVIKQILFKDLLIQ